MLSVGLMSGTSLDGIDAVLVEIERDSFGLQVTAIASETIPFSLDTKHRIRDAIDLKANAKDLCSLNFELGEVFSKAVNFIIKKGNKTARDISYIASHGQTIWHIGMPESGYYCSTLQLGDSAVIAQMTGIPTISNFRSADIAAGGQGAPLVPYADYLLFHDRHIHRSIHNLGGISNMTILKADGKPSDIIAFDTGPANIMIDEACQLLFNIPFDAAGSIAKSGSIDNALLNEMMSHPYFNEKPPKSTGREMFGALYTKNMIKRYSYLQPRDIIRTFTELVAESIKQAYQKFVLTTLKIDEIIFSGGGTKNDFLLALIAEKMPDMLIKISDAYGIKESDKEAISFAILGYETFHHRPSNVPSATGATKPVILGHIQEV